MPAKALAARLPLPTVPTVNCPIRASLGVLGRKWALIVLRDIAWFPGTRFSDLLKGNPGLTPRVLSFRLQELTKEGFIERQAAPDGMKGLGYVLTAKGKDTIPILTAFVNFGVTYHADEVFRDGTARPLCKLFPHAQRRLLGPLNDYARGRAPRAETTEGRRKVS